MKKVNYDASYNDTSHSFGQEVLTLSDGSVAVATKDDADPSRGFNVCFYNSMKKNSYYFHFWGKYGNNILNAWPAGVVECGGNVFLVGSSAKSMTSAMEEYSTDKNFKKKVKKVTIKSGSTNSKKFKGLAYEGTLRYYVRIRAYTTISGKKNYSTWSKKKSVKM